MLKVIKKIFPLFILMVYFSSTMGLVISYIHCFCENNNQVKLFSLKEESCAMCDAEDKHVQTTSCCAKKTPAPEENKPCCDNQVVYLKINADYYTVTPVTISELQSFFNIFIRVFDPINDVFVSTNNSTFLKEDIPKISGKEMVCYLHQFKLDPAEISC